MVKSFVLSVTDAAAEVGQLYIFAARLINSLSIITEIFHGVIVSVRNQ